MASKAEIFDAAMALCGEFKVKEAFKAKLAELLEPKKGGAAFDIDEVAVRDESGKVIFIFDSVFQLWVPVFSTATDEDGNEVIEQNFYEKPDTELGWSRFSRVAEKTRKDADKKFKATKDAVFADLMNGVITQEQAKELMETAEQERKTLEAPEGFGSAERPTL